MVKRYIKKAYGWRPFRYLVAGGFAFLSDYGTFLMLHYVVGLSSPQSGVMSFCIGLIISFILQRFWVFRGDSSQLVKREVIGYGVLAVINFFVTAYGLILLDHFGIPAFIAKLMIVGMITIWNYLLYKNVIFKVKDDEITVSSKNIA